jgi:hypothetical protein
LPTPTPSRDASMAVNEGASLVPFPLTLFHSMSIELNAEVVVHSLNEAVDFLTLYSVLADGLAPLLLIGQSLMRLGALCAQDRWGHLPAVNWEGNMLNVYDCVLPMFATLVEAPPPTEAAPMLVVPMVEDLRPCPLPITQQPPRGAPPSSSGGRKGKLVTWGPPPINLFTKPGKGKKASFAKVASSDPRPRPAASAPSFSGGSTLVALAQAFPHLWCLLLLLPGAMSLSGPG